jgi:hypothetical protein
MQEKARESRSKRKHEKVGVTGKVKEGSRKQEKARERDCRKKQEQTKTGARESRKN